MAARQADSGWLGAALMAVVPFLTIVASVVYSYKTEALSQLARTSSVPLSLGIFFAGLASACLYLLPTIVAWLRKKRRAWTIFALDLFLGWTGVAWLATLIWASVKD